MPIIRDGNTVIMEDEMTDDEYGKYVVGCITRQEDRYIFGKTILEPEKKKPNWDAIPQSLKELNDGVRIKYGYQPRWSK